MNFKVAICDDQSKELNILKDFCLEYFENRNDQLEIFEYNSMDDLLKDSIDVDIYFIDVIMPGTDGIKGAEILDEIKNDPTIIFSTSSLDAAIDGYRVRASGFLLKPYGYDQFADTLNRVLSKKFNNKQDTITVSFQRSEIELKLDKIVYFENQLRKIRIQTTDNDNIYTMAKLSYFEELLASRENMIRCHQSYIVNLDFVEKHSTDHFLIKGDVQIPISRAYQKIAKKRYYQYSLQ